MRKSFLKCNLNSLGIHFKMHKSVGDAKFILGWLWGSLQFWFPVVHPGCLGVEFHLIPIMQGLLTMNREIGIILLIGFSVKCRYDIVSWLVILIFQWLSFAEFGIVVCVQVWFIFTKEPWSSRRLSYILMLSLLMIPFLMEINTIWCLLA